MQYRQLGQTGLMVSRLCFGSLTIGPLQRNLPVETGGHLLEAAFSMGVNFVDTAESYDNYPHLRWALERGWSQQVHVATKSYAVTAAEMEQSVTRALRELGRDYIDIFLLHEQESGLTLKGHAGALEYLWRAKERGLVRAVGISTHTVAAVRSAALHPLVEVIHPLFNMAGFGILDGTAVDMLQAIRFAHQMGKGLYGMKALGGGHLYRSVEEALQYAWSVPELAAVAVGMQNEAELAANVSLLMGEAIPDSVKAQLGAQPRRLHVESYCVGCGTCLSACKSGALSLVAGKVQVDHSRCLCCGYCGRVCPEFCLKVI
jgi:predicted aldo/keto reductase-like oxidoreductase